ARAGGEGGRGPRVVSADSFRVAVAPGLARPRFAATAPLAFRRTNPGAAHAYSPALSRSLPRLPVAPTRESCCPPPQDPAQPPDGACRGPPAHVLGDQRLIRPAGLRCAAALDQAQVPTAVIRWSLPQTARPKGWRGTLRHPTWRRRL